MFLIQFIRVLCLTFFFIIIIEQTRLAKRGEMETQVQHTLN